MMFIQDHATAIIPYRDLNFCNFIDTGTTLFSPTLVKLIDFCHSRYDYLPRPLQGKYNYTMRSEIQHSPSRMQYIKSSPTSIEHNKSKQKKNWEIWLKGLACIFTIHFIRLSILLFIQSGVLMLLI